MNEKEQLQNSSAYERVGDHVAIFQRGGRWHANYQFNGKQKRKSLRTTSKKQALREAIQLEAKLSNGQYAEQARAPALAAVIDELRKYLQTERRAPKTLKKYEFAFAKFLETAARLKVKTIDRVDVKFMDAFRAQRVLDGAEPKTVHNDSVLLRQVVNFAVRRGFIHRDPLVGLRLSKPKLTPQPCWTLEQVRTILAATPEPQKSLFLVLACTGLRIGELQHLTWSDIDFENSAIHIREKDGWKPKTGDMRVVPMNDSVRKVLEGLPKTMTWVFTTKPSKKHPSEGRQVSERRLLTFLKRVLKKLRLPGHLHTFRHFFISQALLNKQPESLVRRWVGHVDERILRLYTHVADTQSQAAMAELSAAQRLGD